MKRTLPPRCPLLLRLNLGLDWVEWVRSPNEMELYRGLDVNADLGSRLSPLHLACQMNSPESVKLLLQRFPFSLRPPMRCPVHPIATIHPSN